MKIDRIVCLGILIATTLLVCSTPAAAQCQMYSYSDLQLDDNGNAVAINYTDGSNCSDYWAHSDVTLTMPSGYATSAAANGGCCAEAVAFASAVSEDGSGALAGNNEVDLTCDTLFGSFDFPIVIGSAQTKANWITGAKLNGWCAVTSACSNTTTPMCTTPATFVGDDACAVAWVYQFVTARINGRSPACFQAWANRVNFTEPAYCTPAVP